MNIGQQHYPSIETPLEYRPLAGGQSHLPACHRRLRGIAFWIWPNDQADMVRIIITLQALAALSKQRDYDDIQLAFGAFGAAKDRIESAARAKYEEKVESTYSKVTQLSC